MGSRVEFDEDEARRRWASGETLDEIIVAMGIGLTRASLYKRLTGGARRRPAITRDDLAPLVEQGRYASEIAAKLGVSHSQVVYWALRHGLYESMATPAPESRVVLDDARKTELRTLYRTMTIEQIAARLGVSTMTAHRRLMAAGVTEWRQAPDRR